ncbi:MAG: phosphoribosylglycinamide formyltransferase [Candidatus Omnitrophota bacterium]
MKRIAFLVSGSGTNMANIVAKIRSGEVQAEAALVISNKPGVKALEKAAAFGVKTAVIDHKAYADREAFDKALDACLEENKVDLVVLAGFMRILTEGFVKKYYGRLINIHPALLPAFPGGHAIKDAWDAKVKETGVSVHFVDAGVDTGAVILQRKVPVLPTDTIESLEARIHEFEYEIYPQALNLVLSGKASG